MNDPLPIAVCSRPIEGSIRPPGSKSITNRALVCAALATGESLLTGVLDSQDTRVMAAGLSALGFGVVADWPRGEVRVTGAGGVVPAREAMLDCAASGTTIRFLSAVCAIGHGIYRLDGTPRMRKRPIGDLLESLQQLGVEASAESAGGCPPVVIRSEGIAGGRTSVRGSTSSQFASGLAMVAPCLRQGMQIDFEGTLVSLPYLEMTRRVMEDFGASCVPSGDRCWRIAASGYRGRAYAIEPDASAASYFLAAAAITGGTVRVEGLSRRSMQGDVGFADALGRMGCTVTVDDGPNESITVSGRAVRGIDIDMNAISDTVPTLAVVALFAKGPTTIRNVAHIRDKETDRIGDLACELRRLGATVAEQPDGLTISLSAEPISPATHHGAVHSGAVHSGAAHAQEEPMRLHGATVQTYDDHRMAMSLALAGLRVPGVCVADPGCVGKTFPDYWNRLAAITGRPHSPL